MADIQDNNIEMNVNSENKICAKGDAGSTDESNAVCALKKTDNDHTPAFNGFNGVDSIKNEGADHNGTDKHESPNLLEENVKLNGNSEAEALSVDKDEAAVSSTEKELGSGEEKPVQDEKASTETTVPVEEEKPVKENDTCAEVIGKSVGIPAENGEKADITKTTEEKEAKPSVFEKSIADNSEESAKPLPDTKNKGIDSSTEVEKTTFLVENEPITETKATNDESVEKSESEKSNSVDETCAKVVETETESAKPSESEKTNSVDETCTKVVETNDESAKTSESEKTNSVDETCTKVVAETSDESAQPSESEKTNSVDETCTKVVETNDESAKPSESTAIVVENNEKSIETPKSDDVETVEKSTTDEEASKLEQVEKEKETELASETKATEMDQEVSTSSENPKPCEEVSQDDFEKMEVDEPDTAPASSELPSSTVEGKTSPLSTDCRVVLVKVNESDDLDTDKKTKSPSTRGTKRKRSSEPEEADDISKDELESENGEKDEESSPVQKNKKQKVEPEEKESPSARKSKRISDKKELTSPASEKSPSKRSRQSTPSSTPKKSITPSPRSKSKKNAESADDKSASETEKTPQKTATRVSSRTKRSLNLSDDEESTPSASKRQNRRKSSKATPKAKAVESDNEDEVSEEETSPPSAKKGRASKAKANAKGAKKSAAKSPTDDAESGSDSEGEVDNAKSTKSGKKLTAKLDQMKRLLVTANLRVNNYAKFFKDCETDKEKIDHIVNHLRENGLKGEPTIANCKKLGKKIEQDKEMASLSQSNILNSSPSTSGTRLTRSRRSTSRRG